MFKTLKKQLQFLPIELWLAVVAIGIGSYYGGTLNVFLTGLFFLAIMITASVRQVNSLKEEIKSLKAQINGR